MGLDVNERLARVLEHAAARDPDAYFLTGDFCATEPRQETFFQLRPILDQLGKPYYITPGNHDDRHMLRNAFFLEGHNDEPIIGLVRVNDRDFLFLDSCLGAVGEDQQAWLSRAIAAYPAADIVMHHPPVPMGVTFMDGTYPLRNPEDLLPILAADGALRRVFCGHFHSGRMVHHGNLEVHLCPPTSFFINPEADNFEQDYLPPAYTLLEWTDEGDFRSIPTYVAGNARR